MANLLLRIRHSLEQQEYQEFLWPLPTDSRTLVSVWNYGFWASYDSNFYSRLFSVAVSEDVAAVVHSVQKKENFTHILGPASAAGKVCEDQVIYISICGLVTHKQYFRAPFPDWQLSLMCPKSLKSLKWSLMTSLCAQSMLATLWLLWSLRTP